MTGFFYKNSNFQFIAHHNLNGSFKQIVTKVTTQTVIMTKDCCSDENALFCVQ